MNLYPYQQVHFDRLVHIFEQYKIAIDTSKTGSGKTIVAIFMAQYFLQHNIDTVIIVCPPTLSEHWQNYVESGNVVDSKRVVIYSSHSSHKIKMDKNKKYFLIVDECHLFKNAVQRTRQIKRVIEKATYALMLSATPYDDNRQYSNIRQLFQIQDNIQNHLSCMDFDYSTKTEFEYYHAQQDDQKLELYGKGYYNIYKSSRLNPGEGGEAIFNAKMFSSGIQKIHDSLVENAYEYTRKLLTEEPQHKFVVVMNFVHHFEYFEKAFSDIPVLVLNGKTPMQDRHSIISKFQQPNLNHRIICISGEVGSVGIELDDKSGQFPRHMIILPMTNAVNFCQAIGRIQRARTQSHSKVSVVQPTRHRTYFKNQIQRKFKVLEQFMNIPHFRNEIEHHSCELDSIGQYVESMNLPEVARERIQEFLCDCLC